MPLVQGRHFRSTDDDKVPSVAIVNHAFADCFFPHGDAIGRTFWFEGRNKPGTKIIGEVADSRTDDLTQQSSPEIYLPLCQAAAFSKHLARPIRAPWSWLSNARYARSTQPQPSRT